MRYNYKKQEGYIALLSVVIVGAFILAVSVGSSFQSTSSLKTVIGQTNSQKAVNISEACAEYALIQLKNNLNYSGNETIMIGDESCEIREIDGSGAQDRTVKTKANVTNHHHRIKVEVGAINPNMEVDTWEDVTNF